MYDPVVFAVGSEYQIFVLTRQESLVMIKCGGNTYYDDDNGIMRSANDMHRVCLPMEVLDREEAYTVELIPVIERKPYYSKIEAPKRYSFPFRPIRSTQKLKVLHIADTHGRVDEAVNSAWMARQGLDLLILNGDIANSSDSIESLLTVYRIASILKKGQIPCVSTRGNHDMRGKCAELLSQYMPTDRGLPYYTFRLGSLWGIVLDAGEDKNDDFPEYSSMVCCHSFRRRETAFIQSVVDNADREYNAPGVERRILVCHHPFSFNEGGIFTIEVPLYKQWCALLREHIQPEIALCGHIHRSQVWEVGGENDHNGQACPVVVSGDPWPKEKNGGYSCATILFDGDTAEVFFTNHLGVLDAKAEVKLKK